MHVFSGRAFQLYRGRGQLLSGHESGALFAVRHRKVLTVGVYTVFTVFASQCTRFFNAFPANVAEFALQMRPVGPTVRHRIFDDGRSHRRTGRDDRFQASIVNDKVAHFANASLSDQAPQHVGTVMAVGRLVKRFLAEKVSMAALIQTLNAELLQMRQQTADTGRAQAAGHAAASGTGRAGAVRRSPPMHLTRGAVTPTAGTLGGIGQRQRGRMWQLRLKRTSGTDQRSVATRRTTADGPNAGGRAVDRRRCKTTDGCKCGAAVGGRVMKR